MAIKPRPTRLSQAARLMQARAARKGVKVAEGVHADIQVEAWYRRQLFNYLKRMREDIEATLVAQLRNEEYLYADALRFEDSFVDNFGRTMAALIGRWSIGNALALELASGFVGRMNEKTKQKLEKSIGRAMGVDLAKIVTGEGLSTAIDASIRENVRLIKTIPEQYLEKVQRIIDSETIKGRSSASIIEQIRAVYPVSVNRARVIARDQSNKVNGDLTRERQTSMGIRGYRWRTVGDGAVRETHKERNGKVYAWRPEDVGKRLESGEVMLDPEAEDIGHPGEDIQCRCIAEPILEIERLI